MARQPKNVQPQQLQFSQQFASTPNDYELVGNNFASYCPSLINHERDKKKVILYFYLF